MSRGRQAATAAGPTHPDFSRERRLWAAGIRHVAGVDEAGRGPLAGPVVAAAVIFLEEVPLPGLDDSKKLTPSRRESLFHEIRAHPRIQHAVAWCDAGEVDALDILRAAWLAMARAVGELGCAAHALVDGLPVEGLPVPHEAVVGGDRLCASIAAASILAKVTRDRMMLDLDRQYPAYGFAIHKGYPTRLHLAKLREHGPCPVHRRSFAPVARAALL
ncbi:MAG: ribonuclease HII [Terrimicrobiaceae bacterium]|nr:ribonuclease HII [Terrimicrobiaceae bacterium]